ncbi:class I SAM-dependent methyltransferase [Halomarina oriensis]|uniref:Methyltransferase domain-containing protein n=1 Tax=Halomarina oriensis TaxID=671145 RepID=A0A6B0GP85_9EURY|nr:class I SAM-dependent methyltransferase [Halomarina oriensis]MWG35317.1 methyltransferase domain-containing protein [Halomarina oriensis]
MRRFSADYLDDTRRGMWSPDDREALEPLALAERSCVLDVGCGTGELSAVLAEECDDARVAGLDRDPALLAAVPDPVHTVQADALSLPVPDATADLVVCQALLVNLPDPLAAVEEFRRASSNLVAAVEPDNAAVTVESTVDAEERLTARAREHFVAGVPTDVTLGAAPDLFRDAGLVDVETRRYDHVRVVDSPYDESALEGAKRKATASRLGEQRETLLEGGLSAEEFDALRHEWREMGRAVVAAMADGEYHRVETVPFFLTLGRVPGDETDLPDRSRTA